MNIHQPVIIEDAEHNIRGGCQGCDWRGPYREDDSGAMHDALRHESEHRT